MAYTVPTIRATGDLVTAAIFNTDLVDNIVYLKTQTDLIDDCVLADVSGTRALTTVYQNAASKILIALVSVLVTYPSGTGGAANYGLVGAANPPTSAVCRWSMYNDHAAAAHDYYFQITLVVPPSYYYEVVNATSIYEWIEFTLH